MLVGPFDVIVVDHKGWNVTGSVQKIESVQPPEEGLVYNLKVLSTTGGSKVGDIIQVHESKILYKKLISNDLG